MFIHMLTIKPQIMSLTINAQSVIVYRKRPEPCKVVSFSSLNKTEFREKSREYDILVSSNGDTLSDSWQPLASKSKNIEISSSGWNGLVTRYTNSKTELLEVA
jgi:hypothetical protein